MYYQIDLDPAHSVIRLTITEEMMTLEYAEQCYRHLRLLTASGGPYAAIYDLSIAKGATIPTELIRSFVSRRPAVPKGRKQVVVGKEPQRFGLARLFQMCSEGPKGEGPEFEVVHSLEEAYKIVDVHPEDFTQCLIWP